MLLIMINQAKSLILLRLGSGDDFSLFNLLRLEYLAVLF